MISSLNEIRDRIASSKTRQFRQSQWSGVAAKLPVLDEVRRGLSLSYDATTIDQNSSAANFVNPGATSAIA